MYDNMIDPMVSIANCGASCPYGEYKFMVTQSNGYYNDHGEFVPVCWDTDEVSVWIYEPPTDVDAGLDQELCDVFTFDLTAVGSDYCSTATNWYSWGFVSQPADAGCNVSFIQPVWTQHRCCNLTVAPVFVNMANLFSDSLNTTDQAMFIAPIGTK